MHTSSQHNHEHKKRFDTKRISDLLNVSKLEGEYVTIIDTGTSTYKLSLDDLANYVTQVLGENKLVTLQVEDNILQYRCSEEEEWTDLYDFSLIGGSHYLHIQSIPKCVWRVKHGLNNRFVTTIIIDSNGDEIEGFVDRKFSTDSLLVIRFSEPVAGKVYIKN